MTDNKIDERKDLTETQIRMIVLKEQFDEDPEFKEQVRAYTKIIAEFGETDMPVYLANKFENLEDLVKARLNSNLLQ